MPSWLLHLERGHDSLRRAARLLEGVSIPALDLRPAAHAAERAFVEIFNAMDQRTDRLHAARAAIYALADLDSLLRPAVDMDPAIGATIIEAAASRGHVTKAEARLAVLAVNEPAPGADLQASRDVPILHDPKRATLAPILRVEPPEPPDVSMQPPPPLPEPKSFEEMEAVIEEMRRRNEAMRADVAAKVAEATKTEVDDKPKKPSPTGFLSTMPDAETEDDFLRARARELFEEITMVGAQRAPLLGDPWRYASTLERRMLNAIDALASLGHVALASLEPLVLDSPAKDPTRAFGIGMALGCIGGRDALAAAERATYVLRQTDPEAFTELGHALKIAPHPMIGLAMRTLLADADPASRALAIDVLGARAMATPDELGRAAADAPVVAAKVLERLALTRHPALASAIAAGLASEAEEHKLAAWLAMAIAGDPRLSATLGAELSGPHQEQAALWLALAGDQDDATTLLEAATKSEVRPLITAVGWAGSSSAIVPLIEMLKNEDPVSQLAAAYALDRITGAGLYEEAQVPAEEIVVADPPDPDVGEPPSRRLARQVSDPRDLPREPAPDTVQQPTTDIERWRAYWTEKQKDYRPNARYRRGLPYTPLVVWNELNTGVATPGERRSLQRELCIRTGQFVRLDPNDFVATQELALQEWLPIVQRMGAQPGVWTRPYRAM